jgi:mannose-1-phosphate guanylyltransferase
MIGGDPALSGIILAGGEGLRVRALTRALAGDDRPKQFCHLVGGETLLDQTRRRAARLVAPASTVVVVTRAHERFYGPALAGVPARSILVQPENRGTAPAILAALLRLRALTPPGPVVMLPSDHYVSDDAAFMARVEAACDGVRACPDRVVLLGVVPDRPETEYGWIEPGQLLAARSPWALFGVKRFWEKPGPLAAERLAAWGALWNSFVIVAQPATLERTIREAVPTLDAAFDGDRDWAGPPWAVERALRDAYAAVPGVDLSTQVLERRPDVLAVLPVSGVAWNDLGAPARVLATRRQLSAQPVSA